MNRQTEKPTRSANAYTVRLLLPLSRIKKNKADTMLAIMSIKAMRTMIFINDQEGLSNG